MEYRWSVAHEANKDISLKELLGIDGRLSKLNYSFDTIATRYKPYFLNLTIDSNKDAVGHLREVEDVIVNASSPIAVLIGAPKDKFDILLKIYQGEDTMALRGYFDNKSLSPGNLQSVHFSSCLYYGYL